MPGGVKAGTIRIDLEGNVSGFFGALDRSESRLQKFGQTAQRAGTAITLGISAPLGALGGAALKSAIDFETALAGVAKTVDASDAQIQAIGESAIVMSEQIPVAATELLNLAEAAGQLGIETQNIEGFTRVMADLGVSTNLASTEAATALARLANITQMPQDQFDRLGSTVVALGNSLATTEREIVEMGLRIAGAGKIVGMTEAQILGFAGALSSVGVEAQAGGTAISRTMVEIANAVAGGGQELERFAAVAGMSAEQFKQEFERDAAGAIITFIEGLRRLHDEGENVFAVLEAVELQDIRVRDALLRAAGAGELLRKSVDEGSKAWEENTALTNEAERFYATLGNQLAIVGNMVRNVAADFGAELAPTIRDSIPLLKSLLSLVGTGVDIFGKLPAPIRTGAVALGAFFVAAGPVLTALGFMSQGLAGVLSLLPSYTAGTNAAAAATLRLNAAMKAGVWVGIAAAIWDVTRALQGYETTLSRVWGTPSWMAKQLGQSIDRVAEMSAGRMANPESISAVGLRNRTSSLNRPAPLPEVVPPPMRPKSPVLGAGIDLAALLGGDKAEKAGEKTRTAVDEIKDALARLGTETQVLERMEEASQLVGFEFDSTADLANSYRSAIESLLGAGMQLNDQIPGTNKRLIDLVAVYSALEESVQAAEDRQKAELEAMQEAARAAEELKQAKAQVREELIAIRGPQAAYTAELERIAELEAMGAATAAEAAELRVHARETLEKATEGLAEQMRAEGMSIGKSLVMGIFFGMDDWGDWLRNAVMGFAEIFVTRALEDVFKSASPSRVTMDIGGDLARGLALGLQTGARALEGAVFDTASSMLGASGAVQGAGMGGGDVLHVTNNYTIRALDSMDVRRFMDQNAPQMAARTAQEIRKSGALQRMIGGS